MVLVIKDSEVQVVTVLQFYSFQILLVNNTLTAKTSRLITNINNLWCQSFEVQIMHKDCHHKYLTSFLSDLLSVSNLSPTNLQSFIS